MNLVSLASHYYRTTISIFLFVIVSGSLVFNNIPKESSPDVSLPYIYVSLGLTGISPEDSEKLLIKPVEDEISNIEGKNEMTSTSYQGGGNILLEFNEGFDPDQALLDTREQVDRAKSDLPDDADEPKVSEVNISIFPILVVSISGDISEFLLKKVSNDLKDKIQSLPNVLEVQIGGEREEQLDIIVDQNKIEAYGLDLNEILSYVRANNQIVSAGNLDTGDGRFVIKIPGLYENLNDIFNTPIKVNNKKTIKFKDIASLKRTFKDPEKFARLNNQSAFTLEISKRIGANIVETVDQVKDLVAEEQKNLPSKIKITFSGDESINIKNMLGDLQNNVIFSILLVMSVVILFLGIRSSLLVGLAVPGSFLAAILVLYTMGFTINMVVLFGLILSVGLLVDGAVVVVEYAQRKIQEGMGLADSYIKAASRMSLPIIASTLTTIAAFVPLLFWPGTTGGFMKYIPITVISVLGSSLAMALIVVPIIGTQAYKIRNLFFFFIIPVILFAFINFIAFNFLGQLQLDKYFNIGIKIISTILIGFLIYKAFKFLKSKGFLQKIIIPKINADEDEDLTDLTKVGLFTKIYLSILRLCINNPFKILFLSVVLLIGIYGAYGKFGKGVIFFPSVEAENTKVIVYATGNLSVKEKDQLVGKVERRIIDLQTLNNEFESVYTTS